MFLESSRIWCSKKLKSDQEEQEQQEQQTYVKDPEQECSRSKINPKFLDEFGNSDNSDYCVSQSPKLFLTQSWIVIDYKFKYQNGKPYFEYRKLLIKNYNLIWDTLSMLLKFCCQLPKFLKITLLSSCSGQKLGSRPAHRPRPY